MQTWQSWQTTKTLVWTDGGCQTLTNALHLVWRRRCGVIVWNGGFRTCPVRRSNDGSIPSCRERYCQQVGRRKLSLDPTWRRSCKGAGRQEFLPLDSEQYIRFVAHLRCFDSPACDLFEFVPFRWLNWVFHTFLIWWNADYGIFQYWSKLIYLPP